MACHVLSIQLLLFVVVVYDDQWLQRDPVGRVCRHGGDVLCGRGGGECVGGGPDQGSLPTGAGARSGSGHAEGGCRGWGFVSRDVPRGDCLGGLVVKVSTSRAADLSSNPAFLVEIFPGCHTSDFKIGTPVVTLLGAWCFRISAGTG